MRIPSAPTIALLPWGNVIEDFLDNINISLDQFCDEMTGGWLFGYIEALQLVGIQTVMFCISARITTPICRVHQPTGSKIWILPVAKNYLKISQKMLNPYGWTIKEAFGDVKRVNYFFWGVARNIAPYLATPLSLLSDYLRQEGCCRILCQEYEYPRFDWCVLLGHLMNLPVYATFQGGDFQLSHFEKPLRPLSLRTCTGLIIPSEREIQRVKKQYGLSSQKIARIFNPLNLTQWEGGDRSLTRLNLNISPNAQVVVWHGRIDFYRKGLDILLLAWQKIISDRPQRDLKLLLVGTGNDAEQLRQKISAMELKGVIWIDEYILDRSLIRDYLRAADVYTLASRQEGFPVAPLEAMACDLPIVATNAHGIPEILEGGEISGGIIVPKEDPTALALGIGRILDDDTLRKELGQRARQRIETQFSLKAVGLQLGKFLKLC